VRRRLAVVLAGSVIIGACSSSASAPDPAIDDSQAFCLQLRNVAGATGALARLDLSDPATIDAALLELRNLESEAPPSITDDLAIVTDALAELIEALETPDNRSPAEVVDEQSEMLEEAGVSAETLESYAISTCGFDLGPPEAPTPTPEVEDDLRPA